MSDRSSESNPLQAAEDLLGDLAERAAQGQRADFESLVRAHPSLENELRALHAAEAQINAGFEAKHQEATDEAARVQSILSQLGEGSTTNLSQRYQLESEVGKGGMGIVYRVRDTKLDRQLAMKVILGQAEATRTGKTPPIEARRLQRFVNEAKITGQLDHPGIVPVHEVGVDAVGRAYFTMKLVQGTTLADVFARRAQGDPKWSMPRVLEVITRVCEAMAFAHERGVIHRDLKPQNIMVGDFGEVYVMDWGLARRLGDAEEVRAANAEVDARLEEQLSLTRDGSVVGTPAYMSPEQARGEISELDERADVYALGAMLYELLSGAAPFTQASKRATGAEILARVLTQSPQPITDRKSPPELIAICEKAMQRDREQRYPNLRELVDDLQRFLTGRTVKAFETGAWAETRKWVKRNKALSGSVAAALVVVSGLLAQQIRTANALERTNTDLAEQTKRAAASEKEATDNAMEATKNAIAANLARDEATQLANDVLSLSAQKDYEDLVAAAEKLWPADSAMVPRYEEWLAKARELIEGRPADEAKRLKKRPSLAEHKGKLVELRRDALPLSDEQIRMDRETHPQFADWQAKSADLLWRSRMLAIEAWPDRAAVDAALAAELAAKQLPSDADGLNTFARKLVDPKQPAYGQEVRALLLAERALKAADAQTSVETTPATGATQAGGTAEASVAADDKPSSVAKASGAAAASSASRAEIRDTYAWALYRNGKLDEALAEMKTALSEPGGDKLKQSAKDLEKAVQQWQGNEVAKRRERRDTLSKEVDALAAVVNERRTFEYTDPEKTWWDRQLRVLVANLENFQNPDSGLMGSGVNPDFGWGVQKRYEFAKSVRELTVESAEAKRRWDEAILAISKSEKYRDTVFPGGGLLTPQEGLLPLGPDPQSGLWEFWHVQSGDEAERDKDGNFVRQKSGAHKLVEKSGASASAAASSAGGQTPMMGAAGAQGARGTGIVLVLIPGGTFWMGAQKTDPNGQNYDREARDDEAVHRVTLSPYLLSKYELTQGQWSRFTGLNPSNYKSGFNGTVGPTNPVEQVDWLTCERVTRRLGLELPSEAQWEFGARGGTNSVWWTGSSKESLAEKVNLADKSYVQAGGSATQAAWWPEFNDGFPVHSPVGRLAANDFGLHEVCGNVWEWCIDAYGAYPAQTDASAETRDPRVDGDGLAIRVNRGGSFNSAATNARSAYRDSRSPTFQGSGLGVRPSRALQLPTSPLHNAR